MILAVRGLASEVGLILRSRQAGTRTAQSIELLEDLLKVLRLHVADIGHKIGGLRHMLVESLFQSNPLRELTSPLLSLICLSTLWSPRMPLT